MVRDLDCSGWKMPGTPPIPKSRHRHDNGLGVIFRAESSRKVSAHIARLSATGSPMTPLSVQRSKDFFQVRPISSVANRIRLPLIRQEFTKQFAELWDQYPFKFAPLGLPALGNDGHPDSRAIFTFVGLPLCQHRA